MKTTFISLVIATIAFMLIHTEINAYPRIKDGLPVEESKKLRDIDIDYYFLDAMLAMIDRNVHFKNSEPQLKNEEIVHTSLGFGILFPKGVNFLLGNEIGDLLGPFGIRLGYLSGGAFSPGGDTLDINSENEEDFKSQVLELDFTFPYDSRGKSISFMILSWDFFGETDVDSKFRDIDIPAQTRIKQSISIHGVCIPVTLDRTTSVSFGDTDSVFGMLFAYEFVQVGIEALEPAILATVPNHSILTGIYIDWGFFTWAKLFFSFQFGSMFSDPIGAIVHVDFKLEFTHQPDFWFGDLCEFLFSISLNYTETNLGKHYIFDPAAENPDEEGAISWTRVDIRFGLRIWF